MSMQSKESRFRIPVWLGTCLFLAIAAFYLWTEHRAHLLGALPYLILLACPLIHVFMHRGHGHEDHGGHSHGAPGGHDSHERGGER